MSYSRPETVTLVNSSARLAPPLKRPADFASFTTPSARAFLGIATLPSISMGAAMVAENLSPEWAVLELMVWSSTADMTVSAGTTKGLGSRAFLIASLVDVAADGALAASEPLWAWSADFLPWQPVINKPRKREHTTIEPQRRIMENPPILGWRTFSQHTPKYRELQVTEKEQVRIRK